METGRMDKNKNKKNALRPRTKRALQRHSPSTVPPCANAKKV